MLYKFHFNSTVYTYWYTIVPCAMCCILQLTSWLWNFLVRNIQKILYKVKLQQYCLSLVFNCNNNNRDFNIENNTCWSANYPHSGCENKERCVGDSKIFEKFLKIGSWDVKKCLWFGDHFLACRNMRSVV
jgi:hypothetical protein